MSAGRLAEELAQRKGLEANRALIEQLRKRVLGAARRLTGKERFKNYRNTLSGVGAIAEGIAPNGANDDIRRNTAIA